MSDPLFERLARAVAAQYLVEEEIGRGGMGVVVRARDRRLQRAVAIKVLPPELAFHAGVRERFLREAQTAAQLAHPQIVPVYTVDEREGLVYFVMALVEGESLAQHLATSAPLAPARARAILADVAAALAYAHERGVVHRDVKPDNILLDRRSGRAVVTDFGIARAAQGESRLTVTGAALGTPAYMSPEQATGDRELDGRSDIYSLGVIGYQLLAGTPPFRATNTPALLVKHVTEAPRPLAELCRDAPRPLCDAIMRALAKRPEDRWPDADAFRTALLAETRARPMPPQPESRPRENPPAAFAPPAPRAPAWPPPHAAPAAESGGSPVVRAGTGGGRAEGRLQTDPAWRPEERDGDDSSPRVQESIRQFRHGAVRALTTIGMLAGINALTSPHYPWFLFPALAIGARVMSRGGRLWVDGVPLQRLISRDVPRTALPRHAGDPPPEEGPALAPAEVHAGPYGDAVRRAAADGRAVAEILALLDPAERAMIPDVAPTTTALVERIGALALTLHRLDADVAAAPLETLEARLAELRTEAGEEPHPEQARRLALLERQRATVSELLDRRDTLRGRLDSAVLALRNIRLDLLKLRSSGLAVAMNDVSSATQEARALSREIGYAVDALREV